MLRAGISGRNHTAQINDMSITEGGAALVIDADEILPVIGTPNHRRFYSALLGSAGADSGTTNQNTNTGTYYIESHPDYDIHITRVAIVIQDTAVTHGNFGNVAALSSGWDLVLSEAGEDTYLIEKATTGGDVISQAGFFDGFGNTSTTWELTNITGTEDATVVALPLMEYVPGGIRLGRGTLDRLTSTFTDDLTGLTNFTVRALGNRHYP